MYHENALTPQWQLMPPKQMAGRVLWHIAQSRGGVIIWWLPVLDGGAFSALARVSHLVASYEDFFLQGRRDDESIVLHPHPSGFEAITFKLGERWLVLLFNFSNDVADVSIALRASRPVHATDAETGKDVGAMPVSLQMEPSEVRALICE
jgi:hypothetical protein